MNRFAAVAVALVAVVLTGGWSALGQQESPLLWGPVLGAIGDDFVAMSWNTSRPVGADVRYSTAAHYEATGGWEDTLSFAPHSGRTRSLPLLVPGLRRDLHPSRSTQVRRIGDESE